MQGRGATRAMGAAVLLLLSNVLLSSVSALPVSTTTSSTIEPDLGDRLADENEEFDCFDASGETFDFSTAPDGMQCVVVDDEMALPLRHHCTHDVHACEYWCIEIGWLGPSFDYDNDEMAGSGNGQRTFSGSQELGTPFTHTF